MQNKSNKIVDEPACYLCPFRPRCLSRSPGAAEKWLAKCPIHATARALSFKKELTNNFFFFSEHENHLTKEKLRIRVEGLDPATLN